MQTPTGPAWQRGLAGPAVADSPAQPGSDAATSKWMVRLCWLRNIRNGGSWSPISVAPRLTVAFERPQVLDLGEGAHPLRVEQGLPSGEPAVDSMRQLNGQLRATRALQVRGPLRACVAQRASPRTRDHPRRHPRRRRTPPRPSRPRLMISDSDGPADRHRAAFPNGAGRDAPQPRADSGVEWSMPTSSAFNRVAVVGLSRRARRSSSGVTMRPR